MRRLAALSARSSGALALAVSLVAQSLSAQSAPQPFNPAAHPFLSLAITAPARSTAVAITLAIPKGSMADTRELAGGAWLLGQVVRDQLERRLAASGSGVRVAVEQDHTTFQVLATKSNWQDAYDAVVEEVFGESLDVGFIDRRRTEVREVFEFEKNAPVREFQTELMRLISGSDSAWSRDPRGDPASVAKLTATALAELRSRIYREAESVVTLVGDLEVEPGIRIYGRGRDGGEEGPLRPSGSGAAWSGGRRQPVERPVTNTWIGAAFPARKDASRTILEFLVERLIADLNPLPRESGLLGTQARLDYTPEGPVLVVESTVTPDAYKRWEDRVSKALADIGERYDDPALFRLHQDRFRNEVLIAESAPDVHGERIAMDLLRDGRVREISTEISGLTADRVRQAIRSGGQPRLLVFGPDLP